MRPGLTEKAFRAQEETIAYICLHYPSKCTFIIKDGSVATKVARLRDAIASHKSNHWTSLHIDWVKFDASFHKGKDGVEIVQDGETIIARPRGQKLAKKVEVEFIEQQPLDKTQSQIFTFTPICEQIPADSIDYQERVRLQIQAICQLAGAKILNRKVRIEKRFVEISKIEYCFDEYDIFAEFNSDGSIQIS